MHWVSALSAYCSSCQHFIVLNTGAVGTVEGVYLVCICFLELLAKSRLDKYTCCIAVVRFGLSLQNKRTEEEDHSIRNHSEDIQFL